MERVIESLREAVPEAFTEAEGFPERLRRPPLDELEVYRLRLPSRDAEKLWPLSEIVEPLTAEEYGRIDREVREWGLEVLAWYRPFHYLPTELWGIYITLDGLRYLTHRLHHYMRLQFPVAIWYAVEILWQHEVFHFLVEAFSATVELVTKSPKYLPYHRHFYEAYWPNCLEEALANRHVLGRRSLSGIKHFLYAFFDQQPGWYKEYRRFLAYVKFREGRMELCNQIIFLRDLRLPIDEIRPPAWFNVRNIPTFIITARFIPEVPGLLSLIVKPRKLIQLLKREGFEVDRQTGSHVILKDIKGKTIVLSIHGNREVHPKSVNDVQAALNISRNELLRKLGNL